MDGRHRRAAALAGACLVVALVAAGGAPAAPAAVHLDPPAGTAPAAGPVTASSAAHRVVIAGIPGLRWSDVTPTAMPALWRLAAAGSVGSLVVHTISTLTCPVDGWLTLNGGQRAAAPHPDGGPCPPLPAVVSRRAEPGSPAPAAIPGMARLAAWNSGLPYHYRPGWGLLAAAAGPGGCALAIGPGAALALAGPAGGVGGYLPSARQAGRGAFSRCPLTVADLGAVPPPARAPAAAAHRAATLNADDSLLGRFRAWLPAGTVLVVAALADDASSPHLRPVIIDGPGYARGLLATASTRRPGLAFVTDLTATVLRLRGLPPSARAVGSPLHRAGRASLATAVSGLIGQDTAAGVYRTTLPWFFLVYAAAEAAAFGLVMLVPRGGRRAAARAAGIFAGSVPAGTFLANLVPWWTFPHPAAVLYGLAAAWAAVIAAAALAGPWRHDPLGPAGLVGAVTLAVVGTDLMTGSWLALNTPFGLNVLGGNRVYGEGNNTVGLYAAATVLCAAWLAGVLSRFCRTKRVPVLAASAVALAAVLAAGWPGFGDKVGGTVAAVPGLVLLVMAVAGARVTARRAALAAVSGVAVISVFAVASYLLPAAHSDVGAFVGQVLHGGGGGTLQRKVSTNLGSLTATPLSPLIPVAVAALGALLLRPGWFGAGALARARRRVPLLGTGLAAIWLTGLLGWFAEDSGVTVPGAMLPAVLPLAVAIVAGAAEGPGQPAARPDPAAAGKAIVDLPEGNETGVKAE